MPLKRQVRKVIVKGKVSPRVDRVEGTTKVATNSRCNQYWLQRRHNPQLDTEKA